MKKLSIMLFPYRGGVTNGKYEPCQLVRDFAEAGATGLEVMMGWPQEDPSSWAKFDEAARAQGLVYSCYDIGIDLIGKDAEARESARKHCMEQIAFSIEKLRCTTVMVYSSAPAPSMNFAEARKAYGEALAKVSEEAARYGVTVCIEDYDLPPLFSCSGKDMLDIMKYAGPVPRFTFDTGNFLITDETPMQNYAALRPRIGHVHIKDFRPMPEDAERCKLSLTGCKYQNCPIGEGAAQIRECVHALKGDNYLGWLSVEPCGPGDARENGLRGLRFVAAVR